MNVLLTLKDKEHVLPLIDAKHLLNHVYKICDHVTINGEDIPVGRIERDEIKKQLHGQIYT